MSDQEIEDMHVRLRNLYSVLYGPDAKTRPAAVRFERVAGIKSRAKPSTISQLLNRGNDPGY